MEQKQIEYKALNVEDCKHPHSDYAFDTNGIRVYCCKFHLYRTKSEGRLLQEWIRFAKYVNKQRK